MPTGNRETFEHLVRAGKLALNRGAVFDRAPTPLPRELSVDRIEGMLLGLAIGDALGNTTESMLPAQRAAQYDEIRHYLPNPHAAGRGGNWWPGSPWPVRCCTAQCQRALVSRVGQFAIRACPPPTPSA